MTALAPRPSTTSRTVAAQVDAAIDGDERAWEAICERHLPEVRAVASARLRDRHAAEDAVQETLLRAWSRLHQVRDADRLGAWLKTIAANVAVDHVRRQRATAPPDATAPTPADGPSHELGMTDGSVRVLLARARQRVRDGYGPLVAPAVALLERWRSRLAGLGDAVPAAVAGPAVVVAVVAGIAGPVLEPAPPSSSTSIAVAPGPTQPVTSAVPQLARPIPTTPESSAPRPSPVTSTVQTPTASAPASAATGATPAVEVGPTSAGFSDDPPTDDERDEAPQPAPGPVEGVELHLDETGIGDGDQDCVICG